MASIIKRENYQYQVTIRRKDFPRQCTAFVSEQDAEDRAHLVE